MEGEKVLTEIGAEAIKRAFSFLEVILIPPLQEVGLLAQDHIKFWRLKNQVKILNKAQDFLNQKGVSAQKVPLKVLVPLLEHGSLEEDTTMQEKWAALLSNAADPDLKNEPVMAHIEILKQLSPFEARILDLMYDFDPFNLGKIIPPDERDKEIRRAMKIPQGELFLLQSYLIRLGVVEESLGDKPSKRTYSNVPRVYSVKGPTELTDLGYLFVKHCRAATSKEKT